MRGIDGAESADRAGSGEDARHVGGGDRLDRQPRSVRRNHSPAATRVSEKRRRAPRVRRVRTCPARSNSAPAAARRAPAPGRRPRPPSACPAAPPAWPRRAGCCDRGNRRGLDARRNCRLERLRRRGFDGRSGSCSLGGYASGCGRWARRIGPQAAQPLHLLLQLHAPGRHGPAISSKSAFAALRALIATRRAMKPIRIANASM